jgi:hypothetical protein
MSPLSEWISRKLRTCFAVTLSVLAIAPAGNAASVQEISLNQTTTTLSPPVQGVAIILKTWVEENNARSHFEIRLFTKLEFPAALEGYYADVPAFVGEEKITLRVQESADCSVAQTAFLSYETTDGLMPEMVTADRVESVGAAVPTQSDPRPQRLRIFLLRRNTNSAPGRPLLWFQMVSERLTDIAMCDTDSVHRAMALFAEQH